MLNKINAPKDSLKGHFYQLGTLKLLIKNFFITLKQNILIRCQIFGSKKSDELDGGMKAQLP